MRRTRGGEQNLVTKRIGACFPAGRMNVELTLYPGKAFTRDMHRAMLA